MKTRECVRCKKIFTCNGKLTDAPCVCFEERNEREHKEGNGYTKEKREGGFKSLSNNDK
jgi:hypothetical protein